MATKSGLPGIPGAKGRTRTSKKDEEQKPKKTPVLPGMDEDEEWEDDFTGVEAGRFPIIDEGKYVAMVVDVNKGDSKAGNPQYIWEFGILNAEKEVTLKYWTSLLPNARWKVVETLEALGLEAGGSIAKWRKSDVVGAVCYAEVVVDEYEGNENNKIQRIYPADADAVQIAAEVTEDTPSL